MSELTIDRPIKGDVSYNRGIVPQEGPAEFLNAIDNVLAQEGVVSLHWVQFIPSFNDGDACEFTIYDIYARLEDRFISEDERVEDEDEWSEEYIEERPGIFSAGDLRQTNWNAPGRPGYKDHEADAAWIRENSKFSVNGQDTRGIYDALVAVNVARFENVLRANFGDNAEVTATREGFKVDYYEAGY